MTRETSVLALCFVACIVACSRTNPSPSGSEKVPPAAASDSASSTRQNMSAAVVEDSVGILELPDGSKFTTTLYELKVVGQLRTARKLPYYILSGRGCQECDANTSIYLHSPSDGSMKGSGDQTRFAYPGREVNYEDGSPVYEARMFFGDCVARHPNAVIWFERSLGDDNQWHAGVLLAEVKNDNLVYEQPKTELPRLDEALEAVRRGQCQELPGAARSSEP